MKAGYGGSETKRTHLKPIRDIGVDFVDKANTIIKHTRGLTGLQRGLEATRVYTLEPRFSVWRYGNRESFGYAGSQCVPAKLDTPAVKAP